MSDEQMSFLDEGPDNKVIEFTPTREAGLARLKSFAPYAGRTYASNRNYDLGPDNRSNISALSPWVRHRLISEEEILKETIQHHSFAASEKFLQEVFWRAYFKGWLEQKPDVWKWYQKGVRHGIKQLEKDGSLNQRYTEAVMGKTGIEAFDFWAKELVETGYLHNHARMWFASIWIFTLELPWELGADFFYRNLLDGDPASNTCSWRWVAGLHTKGKNYAARASNISKFSNERFSGHMGLASNPMPLDEMGEAVQIPMPISEAIPDGPFILIVTEEDLLTETLNLPRPPETIIGLDAPKERSPLEINTMVEEFTNHAVADALARGEQHYGCLATQFSHDGRDDHWQEAIKNTAAKNNCKTVVTSRPPVGPVADKLAQTKYRLAQEGIQLIQIVREYDALCWPHATRGFFKLKKQMPKLLDKLNLS